MTRRCTTRARTARARTKRACAKKSLRSASVHKESGAAATRPKDAASPSRELAGPRQTQLYQAPARPLPRQRTRACWHAETEQIDARSFGRRSGGTAFPPGRPAVCDADAPLPGESSAAKLRSGPAAGRGTSPAAAAAALRLVRVGPIAGGRRGPRRVRVSAGYEPGAGLSGRM